MPDASDAGAFEFESFTVNRLGYGAMRITGERIIGPPDDEDAARDLLRSLPDYGVDFVDTADSYGPGVSERLLRESGLADRDDVVVATKGGVLRNRDGDWLPRGDPDSLRNAVLCSQDRLGVETIDLYQYHRPDPDASFEASVQALGELKDDGEIAEIGLSNVSVDQLETALDLVDVASVQNHYSVTDREHADVLAACEDHDVAFVAYFPVGAGNLGGAGEVLDDIAAAHDATRYQVALAWLLAHSSVTIPIPGTSNPDHLAENVGAASLDLSEEEIRRLDAVDG